VVQIVGSVPTVTGVTFDVAVGVLVAFAHVNHAGPDTAVTVPALPDPPLGGVY